MSIDTRLQDLEEQRSSDGCGVGCMFLLLIVAVFTLFIRSMIAWEEIDRLERGQIIIPERPVPADRGTP